MESFRAAQRGMEEGGAWQQAEVEEEFRGLVRKMSEVEARVAVLAAHLERVCQISSLAQRLKGEEVQSARGEAQAAHLAAGKEREGQEGAKREVTNPLRGSDGGRTSSISPLLLVWRSIGSGKLSWKPKRQQLPWLSQPIRRQRRRRQLRL